VVKLAELEIACAREHVAYIPESAAGHDFVDGEAKLLVEHGGGLAAEKQLVRRVREDDERSQPVLLETANGVRAPGFESILDDQELLSVTLGSSTVLDFVTWSVREAHTTARKTRRESLAHRREGKIGGVDFAPVAHIYGRRS